MLAAEQDSYLLLVKPDDITISPREVDCPFGTMVCFHSRYSLGDKHHFADPDDFRKKLYIKAVGGGEQGEEKYDQVWDYWEAQTMGQPWTVTHRAVNAELMETIQKSNVILPLFLLDHSGLAMRTTDFGDPWDSGQVGWIYASYQDTIDGNKVNMRADDASENAQAPLTIVNTKGFTLPKTGDNGTMMFTIAGILLMAGAAGIIVVACRKKKEI